MTVFAHKPDERRAYNRGVLIVILALALACWSFFVWQPAAPGMAMMGATMGLSAVPFLIIWTVMMVAMMFPTAAPMFLTFQTIQARRSGGSATASVTVFIAGYLILWALTGILAYLSAQAADWAAARFAVTANAAARFGGLLLIFAGLYQLTPLKRLCLSKCRNPVSFIMTSWRPGLFGAFVMGGFHGFYCFGCCWFLFLILFPLGMMNVAAMAAITILIFIEKTVSWRRWAAYLSAVALLAYGGAVILVPALLPTFAAAPPIAMMNSMPGMPKP
ncbi:DUF2182 domain-containing protein [Acidisoma silvae]|uniref:DUF2182 domain-containing protein n=1 Tax=Acidisoma silvae TaxID=2802396 RepID=A0A963YTR9_9PROT|nr:DUF2182 domain-containing protein [Acidisoma silvae]MCB8876921.1 DUF2182 domain-containing protein [Acidisoma silvae]